MRSYLISLAIGLLLSGCVSAPTEFPPWDIPKASTAVQRPLPVPDRPKSSSHTETTIIFDERGIRELEEFFQVAISNGVISEANANALQAQSLAFNHLLQAAEFQRQIGIIKSELLEQERSAHKFDVWFYRGLLALLGLVSL